MMKISKLLVVFLIMALLAGLAGCTGSSQEPTKANKTPSAPASDQLKDQLFVEASWLKANLDEVIVLDVRKADVYAAGHIPGAISAPWQSLADMAGQPGEPGWGTILPADQLAVKLGGLGINGAKDIITYGAPPGWGEDGRVMWVLRMAGIDNVQMLDGGWPAWQAIKGEESKDVPTPAAVKFTLAALDEDLNVTTEYIRDNQDKLKIVDVRSEKEYQGATDFGEARGGHLPGAISLPFENMFKADGLIKSSDELKELFAAAGLTPEDEIVTYCTKGIRSAHMAMVLRNLGFDGARNWDASFYEWAGNADLSLEK